MKMDLCTETMSEILLKSKFLALFLSRNQDCLLKTRNITRKIENNK